MTYRQSMELEPVMGPSIETVIDGKVAMLLTEALNDHFRLVVEMVILEEMSVNEVATELGITRCKVERFLRLALEALNSAMTRRNRSAFAHRFKRFPIA